MHITLINGTSSPVVLFSVDSTSQQERNEGVVRPGVTNRFYVPGIPELRVKNFNTQATIITHVVRSAPGLYESGNYPVEGERSIRLDIWNEATVTTKLSGLWTYRSFSNPTAVSRTGPQKAQPAAHELILLEADFNLQRGTDLIALGGAIEWEGGGLDLQGDGRRCKFRHRGHRASEHPDCRLGIPLPRASDPGLA